MLTGKHSKELLARGNSDAVKDKADAEIKFLNRDFWKGKLESSASRNLYRFGVTQRKHF